MSLKFNSAIIAPCLLIVGSLCWFQPAIIYWGNHHFINHGLFEIFISMTPLFFALFFILILPLFILPKRIHRYYAALLMGAAISMWIATVFTGTTGVLDGQTFHIIKDTRALGLNGIFFLFIFMLGVFLGLYQEKMTIIILFSVSIISFFFMIYVMGVTHVSRLSFSDQVKSKLISFSKEKNVLLIVLDTFQSDLFQEMLNRKSDLANDFSGFIYFPNASGVARSTFLSIPTLHAGEIYHPGQRVADYYDQTVVHHSFLTAHAQNGYSTTLLNPYLHFCPLKVHCGNEADIYYQNKAAFSDGLLLFNLSLLKSMPHFLKPYLYNKGHWRIGHFATGWTTISNKMLIWLSSSINTDSKVPTIKFLHLFGTHPPYFLNAACKETHVKRTRNAVIDHDECALSLVIQLLKSLKKNHIYNQTSILIVGDHGTSLPPPYAEPLLSVANPLFLYKPFQSEGPLQTSNQLVSLLDIPNTVCAATQACGGTPFKGLNVLGEAVSHPRDFYFNYYEWKGPVLDKSYPVSIFKLKGNPKNTESWQRVVPAHLPLYSAIAFDNAIFENYYGKGWENKKTSHRWAYGPAAELYLPLPPHKNTKLQFTVGTHSENRAQSFTVWVNGVLIGKFSVPYDRKSKINVTIPAKLITLKPTHILFKFAQSNVSREYHKALAISFWDKLQIQVV